MQRLDVEKLRLQRRQRSALTVDSQRRGRPPVGTPARDRPQNRSQTAGEFAESSSSSAVIVAIPLSRGMVRVDRNPAAIACGSSMPSRMRSLLIRAARRGSCKVVRGLRAGGKTISRRLVIPLDCLDPRTDHVPGGQVIHSAAVGSEQIALVQ